MAGGGTSAAPSKFYSGTVVLQPAGAIDAFVRMAPAGAEFVYAEAPEPPRAEECWARAGALAGEGLVRTHHRRRAGGGWQYYVVRTGKGLAARLDPVAAALADPATDRIYRAVKRAANLAQHCPTDSDLARSCGLATRDQAQHRVRKLIDLGLIESTLAYEGGVPFRVVTIVETGKSTALPKKWQALQAAAERESRAPSLRGPSTPTGAAPGGRG